MKNISLVVFDIAGTTVSDKGNINECFRDAFASEGLTVTAEDVDQVMGYRKIEAVEIIVNKYTINEGFGQYDRIQRIHDHFNNAMVAFYTNNNELTAMPFAEELFEILNSNRIKVALNTGFTREITDAILVNLKWDKHPFIQSTICSDEVDEGRPQPFMIKELMNRLDISDASQVVKIGDTEVDIKEGRNSGCGMVVAVTTGTYTREQLVQFQPDHIIDSLQEFPALIHI
ncbi:MAG: HAD hydrolase-like protein [Chitinophagaceae bacterium]|nr:HAD hydrolase-like protein [Chitinophagaceae bacterium]